MYKTDGFEGGPNRSKVGKTIGVLRFQAPRFGTVRLRQLATVQSAPTRSGIREYLRVRRPTRQRFGQFVALVRFGFVSLPGQCFPVPRALRKVNLKSENSVRNHSRPRLTVHGRAPILMACPILVFKLTNHPRNSIGLQDCTYFL